MQPPITEKNIEKLSKNAEKLRELEDRMDDIEKRIDNIKLITTKNNIDDAASVKDIDDVNFEMLYLTIALEKDLTQRVNENFVEVFDELGKKVNQSEIKVETLKSRKYELNKLINELEHIQQIEEQRDLKLNEEFEDFSNEFEFINKNYDLVSRQNLALNSELEQKFNAVNLLNGKLQDLKNILGKLTEVKVTLNKYFSSHFENFTNQEKELIESVKKYRISEDLKYSQAMQRYFLLFIF